MQRIILTDSDHRDLKALLHSEFARLVGPSPESQELRAELERADVVPPEEAPDDVVALKSKVVLRDLHTGRRQTVMLVFPHEADADAGRLSVLEPLGTAILGERVGSHVRRRDPDGLGRLRIEETVRRPKPESDFHLG